MSTAPADVVPAPRLSMRTASIGVALMVLAQAAVALAAPGLPQAGTYFSHGLASVASLLAAAALFYAGNRVQSERLAWGLFGGAVLSAAVGHLIEWVLDAGLGLHPFPSPADVFYIALYPLFFLGLLTLPVESSTPGQRMRQLADTGIALLTTGVLLWITVLEPAALRSAQPWTLLLALAYPLGDTALFSTVLWLRYAARGRTSPGSPRPSTLQAVAMACFVVGSSLVAVQVAQASDFGGPLVNVLRVLGFGLLGLAGVQRANRPAPVPTGSAAPQRLGGWLAWTVYAPYVLLGVTYVAVIWGLRVLPARAMADEIYALTAVSGLVLVRQLSELQRAAQLLRSERRQRAELEVLHALAVLATEAHTVDGLLEGATRILTRDLYRPNLGFLLLDEATGDMVAHASYRAASAEARVIKRVPAGFGVVGQVARSGQPRRIPDLSREPGYIPASGRARSELAVPLKIGEHVLGVIDTESDRLNAFSEADEQLLVTIAGQLATATGKLRLFESEQRRVRALTALHETNQDLGRQLDLDRLLRTIVARAADLLSASSGGLYLCRPEAQVLELVVGQNYPPAASAAPLKYGEGLCGRVAQTGESLLVSDYGAWPGRAERFKDLPGRARLGLPIKWEGNVIGVLSLGHDQAEHFTRADAELAGLFADQAAVAIANARLLDKAQRRGRELASLYDTVGAAATVPDIVQLLGQLAEQIQSLLDPDTIAVLFLRPETAEVETALHLARGARWDDFERRPLGEAGLAAWVITHRQTLHVGDLAADSLPARPAHLADGTRAWLGVPLISRDRTLGAVAVESLQPHKFTSEDARLLEALAGQVSIAIENARLYEAVADDKRRLELLYDLTQNLTTTLNAREVARRALDQVCAALGSSGGEVFALEPGTNRLRVLAARGFTEPDADEIDRRLNLRVGEGLAGWAAGERTMAVVEDVRRDPRWRMVPGLNDWIRASINLPLVAGDELVGVMALHYAAPRSISSEQTLFLTAASASVAVALQNARLFAAEARRALDLTLLNDMTRTGVEISDFPKLLRTLDSRLRELLEADAAYITLWDEQRGRPAHAAADDPRRESDWQGGPLDGDASLIESVMNAGHGLFIQPGAASPQADSHFAARVGFEMVLGLPLTAGNQKIGAALVGYRRERLFKGDEIARGEQAAGQIALAIARARLFEDARRSAEESRAVSDILRALNELPDVTQALPAITAGLKIISAAERVSLALLDSNREAFVITTLDQPRSALNQGTRLPVGATAAASDVLAGRPHLTPDLKAEAEHPVEQALLAAGFRSRLNLPLRAGEKVLGALNLVWSHPAGYASGNLALLTQVADAVALAVEKNRLFTETRRRADELAMLVEVSSALRAASTPDEMLPLILQKAAEIVGAAFYAVYLVESETGDLVLRASQPADPALMGQRHRLGDGVTGRVAASGEIYVSTDPVHDPLVKYLPGEAQYWESIRCSITLPLRSQDQVVGVLDMGLSETRDSLDREVHLLTGISEIAGNALNRATVLETLEQRVAQRTGELGQANKRLKELDQLKDRFVSNVSHELRTPLTNIKLHLGLLAKRGPEMLPRYLPTLERETERLRRLIEDLLDLSRLQSQITPPPRKPLQLADLLADVMAVLAAGAEAKAQTVDWKIAADLPPVSGDRAQLNQVFTNLMGNAVSYTPRRGQIAVAAKGEVRAGRAGVAVAFHNNGPLIPPADVPHLFERFYRGQTGHDSGEPGTGLGLAICKEIVDQHGGQISAASSRAAGTTFSVWLPATDSEAADGA